MMSLPRSAIVCAWLAGSAALGLALDRPPSPPVEAGAADGFSVRRAIGDIEHLAVQPHPMGSPAARQVQGYIEEELRKLAVPTSEQYAVRLRRIASGRQVWSAVRNVLARVKGRRADAALLLVAHYDSMPASPGASDNASGVATLLETARVLRGRGEPRNDVILLFTDSEEFGLAGAESFATQHPWARDAGVVLNFDARGTSGPSLMFETSQGNGWLIGQLLRAAPFPRASSLYHEIYRTMGNDTDLSVFMHRGLPGMNFAFIERPGPYHTSGDTIAALDRATLYQHGSNAVSLALALANVDLRSPAAPDVVYFTIGNWLIAYSHTWQAALLALLVVLLAIQLWWAAHDHYVRWPAVAWTSLAALLTVVASCLAAFPLWNVARRLVPALAAPGTWLYINGADQIGIVLMCVAVAFGALALLRRKTTRAALMVGSLLMGTVMAALLTAYVPGAAYLLIWPALLDLVCIAALLRWGDRPFWSGAIASASRCPLMDAAWCTLLATLPAVLIAPVAVVLFAALGMAAAVPVAALIAVGLALIAPVLLVIVGSAPGRAAIAAVIVAAVAVGAGLARTGAGPAWPVADNVFYARNLDDGQAVWATRSQAVDDWTTQFLGSVPQRGTPLSCVAEYGQLLFRVAPALEVTTPTVTVVRDEPTPEGRLLELRIHSKPGAWWILTPRPGNPAVFLTDVDGMPAGAESAPEPFRSLMARAAPDGGLVVRFQVSTRSALRFTLVDSVDGLPTHVEAPRPAWIVRGPEGPLLNQASLTCGTLAVSAREP